MKNILNIFNCCRESGGIEIEDGFVKDNKQQSNSIGSHTNESIKDLFKNKLIPPQTDKLPTLVLDLDSTLVYSTYEEIEKYDFRVFIEGSGETVAIFVKERPFLMQFLQLCSEKYEIVVFTASKQVYASQVLLRLGGDKYIKHILFREHCTLVGGSYLKDLSLLGRDLKRTIIVDDAEIAFSLQPNNGIHIKPYVGQNDDNELEKLCNKLLKLAEYEDIVEHLNLSRDFPEK